MLKLSYFDFIIIISDLRWLFILLFHAKIVILWFFLIIWLLFLVGFPLFIVIYIIIFIYNLFI